MTSLARGTTTEGETVTDTRVDVRTVPAWPSLATAMAAGTAILLVPLTLTMGSTGAFMLAIVGYVVGAVLVPLGVALHRYLRDEAKRSPYFDPRDRYDKLAAAAMVLGLLAAVYHAFIVATELAR